MHDLVEPKKGAGTGHLPHSAPIDVARSYVQTLVQAPALASSLPETFKAKVRHSDIWLERFKRVGDLLVYLKRFNASEQDPIYQELKRYSLLTFEDIVGNFEKKFGQWASDCTRISDFLIGEEYSVFDILILARNYDTRSGGMFLLESEGKPTAVVIKATLRDGTYPNVWLREYDLLKYYLKSIKGKFGEHYKENKAIIDNPQLPIVTFVRESKADPFVFRGIFTSTNIMREPDGGKAFVLSRLKPGQFDVVPTSRYLARELDRSVTRALASDSASRRVRLAAAPKRPAKIRVVSEAFIRNPDVIAEVLGRAEGVCERCGNPAPFLRRSDRTPYLEVHHRVPLANGGDDSVENAIALCPNCHREQHYGLGENDLLGEDLPQHEQTDDPVGRTGELI
jgi:5-methylcytosine-specific restriction protein A